MKDVIHFGMFDVPGFGIRTQGAKRSWIYQFKIAGSQGRITIGPCNEISWEMAERIARMLHFITHDMKTDPRAADAVRFMISWVRHSEKLSSVLNDPQLLKTWVADWDCPRPFPIGKGN